MTNEHLPEKGTAPSGSASQVPTGSAPGSNGPAAGVRPAGAAPAGAAPAPGRNVPPERVEQVRRRYRWGRWVLAVAALIVGLFVGGAIVGYVVQGKPAPLVHTTTQTVTPPAPSPVAGASGAATGQVIVNQACVRAINEAQTSIGSVGNLISALRALDPARIDQEIQKIAPLQGALRSDLRACRVASTLHGAVPTASPTP